MASSFTSFVDYDSEKRFQPQIAVATHFESSSGPPTDSDDVGKKFLPGEIESSSCENVSFSMQFGESELGRVVCTEVRLRFEPIVQKERDLPQRSKFFDDFYDVPLTVIAKLEVAIVKRSNKGKPDKFHRMTHSLSSMETVSIIKLILKDMRVVTVDLRRSQNGTNLANQLLFFSKTGPIEKMVQVGAAMEERGQKAKIPYNGYDAWHSELQRCQQKTESSANWGIRALHKEGFNYAAQGYPMYVVVSNYLSRSDIERQLQNYKQGRLPIWVWSRANGNAALLLSSNHENHMGMRDILDKMTDSIARCHPHSEKPHIMKLDPDFVSQVGEAYDNLLSLCAIDSYEKFVSREHNWQTQVHDTEWLQLVLSCLRTTFETIRWIVDRDRSVILQEDEGRDHCLVIASLTQICCDPFYRTTTGFQQLIDKMWIALGHPFGERLLGRDDDSPKRMKTPLKASSTRTDVMPTWLLFLDCVAQLHRIYKFEFTFSHHVLIALWDLSLTGMVPAMVCNNMEEQLVSRVGGGPFPLDRYFEKGYSKMFGNIWHDSVLFLESVKKNRPISPSSKFLQCEFIRPPTTPCEVQLWSECYMRWIHPANTRGGGAPSEEVALDEKMIEMARQWRSSEWKRHLELPEEYSSAYPYSIPEISRPIIDLNDMSFLDTPNHNDNSSINSSIHSMSLNQTNNTTNDVSYDALSLEKRNNRNHGTESPVITMRPKQQIVGFSKYAFDDQSPSVHSRTLETPIIETTLTTPYRPTPARRSNTVRADSRPIPPPRPSALSPTASASPSTTTSSTPTVLRVRIDHLDDSSPTVTRF